MRFTEICIRRPVFATVMTLVLTLIGVIAYERLSIREYPDIDKAVVTVMTTYRGADAKIVETQVTKVLEDSLAGIEGIDFMNSISRPEQSQVSITFNLDRDPNAAAADVRDRVGRVRDKLPDEIEEPVIQKVEADAQPIMYLAFTSDRHSPPEITDYADRHVKDRLQVLDGVAEVRIFGERRYSMRIWLHPDHLAARGLTPQDVVNALRQQNVEVPAGRIESIGREFSILSETDLRTTEQFNRLVIKQEDGYLVRLADVGYAEIGPQDTRRVVRYNGETAIALGVVKQATANPLDVSKAVYAAIPSVQESLPSGMNVSIAYDSTVYIKESMKNVQATILEATGLVVLIIFLFLRSLRAVFIPLVTIPVSLLGACALMYLFGFSINTLTLLSMVLAIGLVVDDAIVMLENVHRHIENGLRPFEAALIGSREIGFAIVAMTLTLVAVYVPIGFMSGATGRLFTEFAWALAAAVLVSGFVALTLSPMMCSKFLKPHHEEHANAFSRAIERGLIALTSGYRAVLGAGLKARPLVLLIGLAVAGASYPLFTGLKSELAPYEDQGLIRLFYLAPEGSTIDYTDKYAYRFQAMVEAVPEVKHYFAVSGFPVVSQGLVFLNMKPWAERKRNVQEIAKELAPKAAANPGLRAFPILPPPLGQARHSKPVEVIIQTVAPYEELNEWTEKIVEKLEGVEGLANIDTDLKLNSPQLNVQVHRDKLQALGIDVAAMGRTLETLLGGRQVTRFKQSGEQYDVIVQVTDIERTNPDDLRRIYVRSNNGSMVQLANLVTIRETVAPKELNHFNKLRSAKISANLVGNYSLGEGLAAIEGAVREVVPATVRLDYSGPSREYKQASNDIYITFGLALAFIYLVLSAQFESFRDPLIIMFTVPLSISGALLALWLSGGTLNIYSQVGLVTLIGLITKHGILIVEFANQIQAAGKSRMEAVIEASSLRLRPILMTTGAMVLGAVPLAIATGAGAESRQDIGWVIVGGLLVGTFFTLFVIPVAYSYLAAVVNPERTEGRAIQQPAPAE
ncbi:MAG: efflux RND transporter permease subunit [Alphaproteobacteria bacterium]|nr:efflux RND transporter permease subunit [Alphaproteobacteria bacterium]